MTQPKNSDISSLVVTSQLLRARPLAVLTGTYCSMNKQKQKKTIRRKKYTGRNITRGRGENAHMDVITIYDGLNGLTAQRFVRHRSINSSTKIMATTLCSQVLALNFFRTISTQQ